MFLITKELDDILTALAEHLDWAIDAYRNYLAGSSHNTNLTLCAIIFLTMAEMARARFARLPPDDLQVGVATIGSDVLKIVVVIAVLGVIAIRIMEVFTVSQSIVITVCCVMISALPLGILPGAIYIARGARFWLDKPEQNGNQMEHAPLHQQTGSRVVCFTSIQAGLRYRIDTIRAIIQSNKGVIPFSYLERVWNVATLTVATAVVFLEGIIDSVYRRFRLRGHLERRANDIREGMPV